MARIQLRGISAAMALALFIMAVPMALAQSAPGLPQLAPGPMIAPGCPAALSMRCADGQCAAFCRNGPMGPKVIRLTLAANGEQTTMTRLHYGESCSVSCLQAEVHAIRAATAPLFLYRTPHQKEGVMHRRLVQIAGLAALLSLAQMATATIVTLSSSIAGGTLLLSAVHTGVFDGTSVLPSSYIVNGAYYEFVFGDEKDQLTISQRTVSTEVGSYVFVSRSPAPPCPSYATSCSSLENEVHVRDVTEHIVVDRIGQRESVEVSLAGKVVGSGATTMFQSTAVGDPISAGSSLDFYYVVQPYTDLIGRYHPGVEYDYFSDNYTQTTTVTQDWTKEFFVSGSISDPSILDQLLNTDQLNFSLLVSGDLDLIKGRLILDIADGGSVPEPSSMLLTLLGLAGLKRCRRKA